jgi:hypothetical protein
MRHAKFGAIAGSFEIKSNRKGRSATPDVERSLCG